MPFPPHSQAPSEEKKAGGVLGWIFGTPHGCMLTFLGGSFLLLIASFWFVCYGIGYYEAIRNEMTPPAEREFKTFVMDPIPEGVTHIHTVGAMDSLTSVLVIIFDEDPATLPFLLKRQLLSPVKKEEQADCETMNFSDCPLMDGAEYFGSDPTNGNNKVITLKTNLSRTRVQYAVRGIDILHH